MTLIRLILMVDFDFIHSNSHKKCVRKSILWTKGKKKAFFSPVWFGSRYALAFSSRPRVLQSHKGKNSRYAYGTHTTVCDACIDFCVSYAFGASVFWGCFSTYRR